jgi:hypothetical protein
MSKSSKTKLPPIKLSPIKLTGGIRSDILTSVSTSFEDNKIVVELRLRLPKNAYAKVDNNNFDIEIIDRIPQSQGNNRRRTGKISPEKGRASVKLHTLGVNVNYNFPDLKILDKKEQTSFSYKGDDRFTKRMDSLPQIQRHFRDPFPVNKRIPVDLDKTIKVAQNSSALDKTILREPSALPKIKVPKNNLNDAIRSKDVRKIIFEIKQGSLVTNLDHYPDMFSDFNEDSLALAIKTKNPQIVEMVLDYGAKVSNKAIDIDGNRCYRHDSIYQAIQTGSEKIVKMVLGVGAKAINDAVWPGGESDDGYNSYTQAKKTGNKSIVDLVKKYGAFYAKKEGIMRRGNKVGPLDDTIYTGHDNTTIIHDYINVDMDKAAGFLNETTRVDGSVSLESVEVDISDIDEAENISDESMQESDLFAEQPRANPSKPSRLEKLIKPKGPRQ